MLRLWYAPFVAAEVPWMIRLEGFEGNLSSISDQLVKTTAKGSFPIDQQSRRPYNLAQQRAY